MWKMGTFMLGTKIRGSCKLCPYLCLLFENTVTEEGCYFVAGVRSIFPHIRCKMTSFADFYNAFFFSSDTFHSKVQEIVTYFVS
jgi:hypothetical protein